MLLFCLPLFSSPGQLYRSGWGEEPHGSAPLAQRPCGTRSRPGSLHHLSERREPARNGGGSWVIENFVSSH